LTSTKSIPTELHNSSVFYFVNTADSSVRSDLEEWNRVAAELVNQAPAVSSDSPLLGRIEANARLILLIRANSLVEPESFRGVRDQTGNLQAGAIVTDISDYLYVDYIATAPWNITKDLLTAIFRLVSHRYSTTQWLSLTDCVAYSSGNRCKSINGAGTSLMVKLVQESISKGYSGRIMLEAVSGTTEFYQRIGFVRTGFGSDAAPEMELTPIAARDLLRRYS